MGEGLYRILYGGILQVDMSDSLKFLKEMLCVVALKRDMLLYKKVSNTVV